MNYKKYGVAVCVMVSLLSINSMAMADEKTAELKEEASVQTVENNSLGVEKKQENTNTVFKLTPTFSDDDYINNSNYASQFVYEGYMTEKEDKSVTKEKDKEDNKDIADDAVKVNSENNNSENNTEESADKSIKKSTKKKKKKKGEQESAPLPVTVDADYISYHTESGEFYGEGNVVAVQGDTIIIADKVDGNMNSHDMHLLGNVQYKEQGDILETEEVFYNYVTEEGSAPNPSTGYLAGHYVDLGKIEKDSTKLVADGDNRRSRCSAHGHKCMEIRAKRVIIDLERRKMTFKNASMYIAGQKIMTVNSYTTKMDKDKNEWMPKLGYSNHYGYKAEWNIGLIDNPTDRLNLKVLVTSKRGTQPLLDYRHNDKIGYSYGRLGRFEDKDDYITDVATVGWRMNTIDIPNTILRYNMGVEAGRYKQKDFRKGEATNKLGFDANLFVRPIPLWDKAHLNMGIGYINAKYSDKDYKHHKEMSYYAGVSQQIGSRFFISETYIYRDIDGISPFNFDYNGHSNTWNTDISYLIHPKWLFTLHTEYDVKQRKNIENDCYLTMNLHCYNFFIGYREKRREWKWGLTFVAR